MGGLKKVIHGGLYWFIGFLTIIVIESILPSILTAGGQIYTWTDGESIGWLMAILIAIFGCTIIPLYLIINGTLEMGEEYKGFLSAIIGIVFLFIFITFTIKAWYITPTLYALSTTSLSKAAFIIGMALTWFTLTIGVPSYMIFNAVKTKE